MAGNHFYNQGRFVEAGRRYKKATRYYNYFKDHMPNVDETKILDQCHILNLVNAAATELKLGNFEDVCGACNSALAIDVNNSKALFRRGQAHAELKNYELALEDLKRAHHLVPDNKFILSEFDRIKKYLMEYRQIEKKNYMKLFQ
jgi:peptidyl-prolyl isomerase D